MATPISAETNQLEPMASKKIYYEQYQLAWWCGKLYVVFVL